MDGRCVCIYFIVHCHPEFYKNMNDANPFICYYDISAVALPVDLSSISSGIFGNGLNILIFAFLHTKFAKDLT